MWSYAAQVFIAKRNPGLALGANGAQSPVLGTGHQKKGAACSSVSFILTKKKKKMFAQQVPRGAIKKIAQRQVRIEPLKRYFEQI